MTETRLSSRPWWDWFCQSLTTADTARIDLYLRSLAPVTGPDGTTLTRVAELVERDVVDNSRVVVWGSRFCPESPYADTETGKRVLDTIEHFETWDPGFDVDASPHFEHRRVESSITDHDFSVIVPPQCCLAIYAGSELVGLFPADIDGECYSVSACLSALWTAFVSAPSPSDSDRSESVTPHQHDTVPPDQ